MSDELQAGEIETTEIEVPIEPVSESAPDSDSEHEQITTAQKPLDEQEGVNKRINQITAEKYEYKRKMEALERQVQEAEALKPKPAEVAITLPDPDLQYDDPDKYLQQQNDYNTAIAKKVYREEQERVAQEQQQNAVADSQRQAQESFATKAESLGINQDDAFKSAQVLAERGGLSNELSQALVSHESSPAIIDYLAKNPADYDELANSPNIFDAAKKIMALESKAVTRNISSAPEPAPTLSGMSARESDDFSSRFPGAIVK